MRCVKTVRPPGRRRDSFFALDGARDTLRRGKGPEIKTMAARRSGGACCVLAFLAACAPHLPVTRELPVPGPAPPVATRPATRTPSGLRPEVFDLARHAFACGRSHGYFDRPVLTVIDYSLPSTERRLWVVDLATGDVLFHELVAHGRNSGENMASAFSNRLGSKQSSLGLFRTEGTYVGGHGYSLRLSGLERGVNDAARQRDIVIHGAPYVSAEFVARIGRLGRSWGCPALDPRVHERVIDQIKNGTALFVYYPDADWLARSEFLHCPQVGRAASVTNAP